MIQVASFGGGVNSTAMLLGMYERGEKVDLVLFADTGGEKPETYRHKDEFSAWLLAHGMPEIIEVRRMVNVPAEQQSHLTDYITLEQECLDKKTLPSIVTGIRSCSDQFKIRPQDRYLQDYNLDSGLGYNLGICLSCPISQNGAGDDLSSGAVGPW